VNTWLGVRRTLHMEGTSVAKLCVRLGCGWLSIGGEVCRSLPLEGDSESTQAWGPLASCAWGKRRDVQVWGTVASGSEHLSLDLSPLDLSLETSARLVLWSLDVSPICHCHACKLVCMCGDGMPAVEFCAFAAPLCGAGDPLLVGDCASVRCGGLTFGGDFAALRWKLRRRPNWRPSGVPPASGARLSMCSMGIPTCKKWPTRSDFGAIELTTLSET
jgi:hypothetical protein